VLLLLRAAAAAAAAGWCSWSEGPRRTATCGAAFDAWQPCCCQLQSDSAAAIPPEASLSPAEGLLKLLGKKLSARCVSLLLLLLLLGLASCS
jgi:hypothetical protein